jgi:TetR/AcrR family transcriptional regulator, ethionamide resistance regulator
LDSPLERTLLHVSRPDDTTRRSTRKPLKAAVRRTTEITRREILEATAFLLSTRPFRELTVGDIMKRTEVGRSAFYAHFTDVFAVVEELLSEIRDEEIAYLEQWNGETVDPAESFERLITNTVALWARRGPMISSMLDAASNDGRIAVLFDQITSRYCEVAAAALRRDPRKTLSADLDLDEVAALVIHGTQGYLKDRLGTPGRGDPLTVAYTLRGMWAAAIYGASVKQERDDDAVEVERAVSGEPESGSITAPSTRDLNQSR